MSKYACRSGKELYFAFHPVGILVFRMCVVLILCRTITDRREAVWRTESNEENGPTLYFLPSRTNSFRLYSVKRYRFFVHISNRVSTHSLSSRPKPLALFFSMFGCTTVHCVNFSRAFAFVRFFEIGLNN